MGKFKKIDEFCKENDREGLIEFLADHGVQNPHKQADIYIESYAKKGVVARNKGKKMSEETKKKMSESAKMRHSLIKEFK